MSIIKSKPDSRHDTYEETVEWYTAYLCGMLDTLTQFKDALWAADAKQTIKETVESIIKDAWVLQGKGVV